jgi:hypothetical protein
VFAATSTPRLKINAINNLQATEDPVATVRSADLCFTSTGAVTVAIEARNVAPGSTVQVRVVPAFGGTAQVVNSDPLQGTFALSTTTAQVSFENGASEVQLSVVVP